MVKFKLNQLKDNAYKKVTDAIYNYMYGIGYTDTFIVKLAVGRNANTASYINEVVYKYNRTIEFLNDWWEGESYVAVLGILPITDVTNFDDIKGKE